VDSSDRATTNGRAIMLMLDKRGEVSYNENKDTTVHPIAVTLNVLQRGAPMMSKPNGYSVKREMSAPPHVPILVLAAYIVLQVLFCLVVPHSLWVLFLCAAIAILYLLTHAALRFLFLRLLVGRDIACKMSLWRLDLSVPSAFLSRWRFALGYILPYAVHAAIDVAVIVFLPYELQGICLAVLLMHMLVFLVALAQLISVLLEEGDILLNDVTGRVRVFCKDSEPRDDAPFLEEATPSVDVTELAGEQKTADRAQEVHRFGKAAGVIGILLFSATAAWFAMLAFEPIVFFKYPVLYFIPLNVSLWFLLFALIGVIFCTVSVCKKRYQGVVPLVLLSFFLLVPLCSVAGLVSLIAHGGASKTTNIMNYGVYDSYVSEDGYLDFFPEKITDDMTPIQYAYVFTDNIDPEYEVYLELKLTQASYEAWREQYKDSFVDFPYASGYQEAVLSNDWHEIDLEHRYMSARDVRKILFCDAECTVIFVTINGGIYFSDSAYFQRFPDAVYMKKQNE